MSVVPISFGASENPPLILIHDISGSPFPYLPFGLHQVLSQYTIYGVSALSESSAAPASTHTSVSAWAEAYAALIEAEIGEELAAQYQGPVVLGGWSLGGILAAEIARVFRRRSAGRIRILGLILLDSHAPWCLKERMLLGPRGVEIGGVVVESAYFTPADMSHIIDLLGRTGQDAWPGMDDIGCPAWLITPSAAGANGLEQWFPDNRRVRRIGQDSEGCDHFSMMKAEWIEQVIEGVLDALKEMRT
ncbi:Alpha/Beta hydrolase protein [Mycena pura]|uniref:Alpha/Beta hydrolase protein n=1 Tax=Mycena pura TaxID=153505 RepID=A0AAD6YSR9_9AGAR|nr:Alpha/Beta hydrolase protein [Mycena pura]